MRKVTCVILFLIALNACVNFNFANVIESTSSRNIDDKQHQSHQLFDSSEEEYTDEYASQESDISGQPIGRWRSTGNALEPKWRDGDSVPLVPFQTARIPNNSSIKKNDNSDEVNDEKRNASNRQYTLWKSRSKEKSTVYTDQYNFNKNEKPERKNDYEGFRSPEIRLSRRRKPPQLMDEEVHTTEKYSNESQNLQDNDHKYESKMEVITKLPYDRNEYLEGVALRYRETFQNYPNEYELNDEEYQKPRPRKRRPPQNYEFAEVKTSSVSSNEKSTSSPIPSLTRSQRKQEGNRRNNSIKSNHNRTIKASNSAKSTENSELKSLLKMQQVEGSSLSEILQRRNLTLSDLLQGKTDVINLLKSSHTDGESEEDLNARAKAIEMMKISASSTISVSSTSERMPWIPSQIVPAKTFDKPFSVFRTSSTHAYQKVLPTQEEQERVHPTESMSLVKLTASSEIPNKYSEFTTTDSVNLEEKDKIKIIYDEDEIMEFSDFSMKNSKSSTVGNNSEEGKVSKIDNLNVDLDSTLSIEQLLNPTNQPSIDKNESKENINTFLEQSSERIQLQNKIPHTGNEDDNVNNTEMDSFELEYQNDGPYDMNINKSSAKEVILKEHSLKNHKTILNHKNDEIYSEIEPDARAEILELFNSGSSAKKLEGLLKARNMSIEDLIALRQRGSSQLHLAEVTQGRDNNFRSATAKDFEQRQDSEEKKEETVDVKIVKPDCSPTQQVKKFIEWIKEKEAKKEPVKEILHIKEFETLPPIWSDHFGYPYSFAPKDESKQKEEEFYSKSKTDINPESNDKSDDIFDILSHFEPSRPFDNQESSEGISFHTSNTEVPSSIFPERKNNSVIPVEDGRVQEIVSDISKTFNNIYRLNSEEEANEERNTIFRLKPSIIASGAILGVTLVVFLGIFIACRIRQKQKYTYRNTFSRAVFQSPVLTTRKLSNTSSLNTIMVNVVATSTTKRPEKSSSETDDEYDVKSDIENDSLDANDSWETIPDFMK